MSRVNELQGELFEAQALIGEVLDTRLQASHDMSALLATEVQRGRIDELEADAILHDFKQYLLHPDSPDDDEPIAA